LEHEEWEVKREAVEREDGYDEKNEPRGKTFER